MKYLCLGYRGENARVALSASDRELFGRECGRALQSVGVAMTLRFESGQVFVSEGPFVQTKEQLSGLLIFEAKDLNHAIQLMSQLPSVRPEGVLEIRPIDEESVEKIL
jgi:hypothetical protein